MTQAGAPDACTNEVHLTCTRVVDWLRHGTHVARLSVTEQVTCVNSNPPCK